MLASTLIGEDNFWPIEGTEFDRYHALNEGDSADRLAHFGGRSCYLSWEMPNPKTATDESYLANILKQQHFSVLEHASATFYIEGVSRSLLAELTRHRHVSFSVESQRYVDYSNTRPVIPPAIRGNASMEKIIEDQYTRALVAYQVLADQLVHDGKTRKQAREAARSVLPNCAPVAMTVTANHRAWRDVLGKRYNIHADAEILELATELLSQLRAIAPATYQDIPLEPYA